MPVNNPSILTFETGRGKVERFLPGLPSDDGHSEARIQAMIRAATASSTERDTASALMTDPEISLLFPDKDGSGSYLLLFKRSNKKKYITGLAEFSRICELPEGRFGLKHIGTAQFPMSSTSAWPETLPRTFKDFKASHEDPEIRAAIEDMAGHFDTDTDKGAELLGSEIAESLSLLPKSHMPSISVLTYEELLNSLNNEELLDSLCNRDSLEPPSHLGDKAKGNQSISLLDENKLSLPDENKHKRSVIITLVFARPVYEGESPVTVFASYRRTSDHPTKGMWSYGCAPAKVSDTADLPTRAQIEGAVKNASISALSREGHVELNDEQRKEARQWRDSALGAYIEECLTKAGYETNPDGQVTKGSEVSSE